MSNYKILITNDDGINSPGIRAAVESVIDLGEITVVAPSNQQTGMGRSLTGDKLARLEPVPFRVNGREITAYQCDCSPALVVRHSLNTIFKGNRPDLAIAGINYGENLGISVTASGTVGAALESASAGIKSIAISKQTDVESHHQYTDQDWSASTHFLKYFSQLLLNNKMPIDVDILKIDVPQNASPDTPWALTKLAKTSYYSKVFDNPSLNSRISDGRTVIRNDFQNLDPKSDIHALSIDKIVSVTPLSVDITSRVDFSELENQLKI